jgi:hypothetical protein
MLGWLKQIIPGRSPRIGTVDGLAAFIDRHAAFIAQKCADDYCRGKAGVGHYALSEETTYRKALAVCRWEGYAAMLMAVSAVAQRQLIEAGAPGERVEACLVGLVDKILAGQPLPGHRPQGWSDLLDQLPERLRWARSEPPPKLAEIVAPAARRLFDVLPIHASHRELDEEVVTAAVQFQFVALSDRMRRQIDPHGIVHDMEAGAASRHGAAD